MHLLNMRKDQPIEVVGVLDDARQNSITQPEPEVEICIPQITPDSNLVPRVEGMAMDLALRTDKATCFHHSGAAYSASPGQP